MEKRSNSQNERKLLKIFLSSKLREFIKYTYKTRLECYKKKTRKKKRLLIIKTQMPKEGKKSVRGLGLKNFLENRGKRQRGEKCNKRCRERKHPGSSYWINKLPRKN